MNTNWESGETRSFFGTLLAGCVSSKLPDPTVIWPEPLLPLLILTNPFQARRSLTRYGSVNIRVSLDTAFSFAHWAVASDVWSQRICSFCTHKIMQLWRPQLFAGIANPTDLEPKHFGVGAQRFRPVPRSPDPLRRADTRLTQIYDPSVRRPIVILESSEESQRTGMIEMIRQNRRWISVLQTWSEVCN